MSITKEAWLAAWNVWFKDLSKELTDVRSTGLLRYVKKSECLVHPDGSFTIEAELPARTLTLPVREEPIGIYVANGQKIEWDFWRPDSAEVTAEKDKFREELRLYKEKLGKTRVSAVVAAPGMNARPKSTRCSCCKEDYPYAEPRVDFKCWGCANG